MKTKIVLSFAAGIAAVAMMQCGPDDTVDVPVTTITPVNMDTTYIKTIVPGFNFPEDSMTIYSWLNTGDTVFNDAAIYSHAWGIWTGLTANSGEIYQGDTLRVFETWLGLGEIQSIIKDSLLKSGEVPDLSKVKKSRTPLTKATQTKHTQTQSVDSTFANGSSQLVAVAYSPSAAGFAISKSIMRQDVVNTYYNPNGIGRIPAFPNDAITLKPVYFAAKADANLIEIPVWPGEPSPPDSFAFQVWNNFVYADTTNSQQPGKVVVPIQQGDTDPAHIAAATCNLSDFIYYEMDSVMAAYVNASQSVQGANVAPGDMAILVAMHVATKEISNWTWQTFYWDPNPAQPKLPGSNLSKPAGLTGAPAHYSAATAYGMLRPNQPISGGNNDSTNRPVIGYNPYLEANFGPSTFALVPNKYKSSYVYGMQTNCMSCHAFAAYTPNIPLNTQQASAPRYSTDQYIDMNDTVFNQWIQLDFAWSLQSTIFATPEKK